MNDRIVTTSLLSITRDPSPFFGRTNHVICTVIFEQRITPVST